MLFKQSSQLCHSGSCQLNVTSIAHTLCDHYLPLHKTAENETAEEKMMESI